MKNTCLFLLAVLFGLGYFYYSYLSGTELRESWWIGPLLALSVVFFLANLQGIYFAIRQMLISGKPESSWKDGDLIGISGRIQAIGDPIIAPFSGRRSVIVEYEMKYTTRTSSGKSSTTTTTKSIHGMLMTPCAVQTARRSVKVIGFPVMTQIGPSVFSDESNYRNAAKYVLTTKFEEMPENPLKIIKQMSELLADDDGDLQANFKNKNFGYDIFEEDFEDSEDGNAPAENPADKEETLYQALISKPYDLEETCIEHGTEVTIFGTYKASKQAVDIGSGLKNIQHLIQPGKIGAVVRKNLIKSVIFTIVFAAITVCAHLYVAKQIGFEF